MARVSMPSASTRLSFVLNDFSGGLVNNINDAKMKDNQSPDMLNMMFRIDGLIQKRPGTVFIAESPFKDSLIEAISYEYEANREVIMYLTHDGLYYIKGGIPHKVWENNGLEIRHAHYMGSLLFTDGFYLYSYNHSDKKIFKIVNPPESFVPASKPAVTGVEREKYIKNIDEVSYYEKWYEPCEYELEDGYKGTNFIPPCIDCLKVHKDRVYITGGAFSPNMIWISDILNPYYYPSALPLQTPPDDDVITALHTYNDALIVGRRDSIFAVFGSTNREDSINQYNMVQINSHTGMANHRSADNVFHMMFFAGSDGNFYKLNPPTVANDTLSTSQLNITLDLTLPPFNMTSDCTKEACTVFDSINGLWYVQIADITLVYNYQLRAWTRYDKIDALNFLKINGVVHFSRNIGHIYRFADKEGNQKYYDDYYDVDSGCVIQLPVTAYWTSRNMDLGTPARVKQFRDTYVISEAFEDYITTVNVKYEVDYIDISNSYVIENEISKWDRAKFDINKFVSRNIDRSLPLMINRRGRTIKVYYGCGHQYWGSIEEFPPPGLIPEHQLVYVRSRGKLYLRVPRRDGFKTKEERYFMEFPKEELNQALLVHNIMGIYELKGYR